ncbi:MAG: DUF2760 domain-containing protein [Thermodesulfobacteriota bacterium]|nr:DUF2760 domain-containing protein [Thermodesulfobacteriota bacterium]
MLSFLTLLTIAIISTLLYTPIPEQFLPMVQMAAIATPTLLLVIQMLNLGKTSRTTPDQPAEKSSQPEQPAAAAKAISTEESNDAAVVQFLARLQEKGRLIDFIMDDISAYDNESVGAAARIVHQGCCDVLNDSFTIEAVHAGEEMETISLADNYDSNSYRLIGKVPDAAPFDGQVLHRGWKTTRVNLPQVVNSEEHIEVARSIIAPAEIEIG